MEILLGRRYLNGLASPTSIAIARCMWWLVDIAEEMDQERQVATGAPFVVVRVLDAAGVLVNLCCDAGSSRTAARQILITVLKADVDVMPRMRRLVRAWCRGHIPDSDFSGNGVPLHLSGVLKGIGTATS